LVIFVVLFPCSTLLPFPFPPSSSSSPLLPPPPPPPPPPERPPPPVAIIIIIVVVAVVAGAVASFVGTTRNTCDGRTVVELEYEAYTPMALKQMAYVLLCGVWCGVWCGGVWCGVVVWWVHCNGDARTRYRHHHHHHHTTTTTPPHHHHHTTTTTPPHHHHTQGVGGVCTPKVGCDSCGDSSSCWCRGGARSECRDCRLLLTPQGMSGGVWCWSVVVCGGVVYGVVYGGGGVVYGGGVVVWWC